LKQKESVDRWAHSKLDSRYELFDPTARTRQAVAVCINPLGERKTCRLALSILVLFMLAFGVFSAAMFAEPTVTKIEEVRCLMHGFSKSQISDLRSQNHRSQIRDRKPQIGKSLMSRCGQLQ
jgi:hypothetical protein